VFTLPNPTSKEIRQKIIQHKQNNTKEKDIAKWLIISQSTVTKIWALHKKTGTTNPKPRTQGRKPKITKQTQTKITQKIDNQPDITLKELIHQYNLPISQAALSKRLTKLGYTFKKRHSTQKDKKNQTP
jgi:transposase